MSIKSSVMLHVSNGRVAAFNTQFFHLCREDDYRKACGMQECLDDSSRIIMC